MSVNLQYPNSKPAIQLLGKFHTYIMLQAKR